MLRHRRALVLPALLGMFVFAVYIFTFPVDLQGNGDTYLRYQTTQSIVDEGHVYVDDPRWTDLRMVKGVDRKWYTIYDPGQIFAMIPLYVAGKFIAHHFTHDYVNTPIYVTHTLDDIFAALLAIVFFLLGLRLGYSRRVAAVLTLIFAFASVIWPDAESMLEHTQVTFFLALSVLAGIVFVQQAFRQRWWITVAALSMGCAFLTRYDTGILLPLIPLYLACARISHRSPPIHAVDPARPENTARSALRLLRGAATDVKVLRSIAGDWSFFLVGLVPSFVLAGLWNYARFGSITKTGIPTTFGEPILTGLSGLTLSPGKGLVWYMPILFLLPFVGREFYRQHRLITLLFLGIVLGELLLFSTVIYWHGDPAWGPRYIYSTVPFLVLPLGIILERWAALRRTQKAGFLAILALSFAVQLVGVLTPQYRFWYKEIHAQLVARQGFNWGYKDSKFWYFYYWNVDRSPILIGFQNLYELTAYRVFGQQRYDLTASPIPAYEHLHLASPNDSYEINNFNLWWLGVRTPFLGTHRDALLAAFWLMLAAGTFVLLRREIQHQPPRPEQVVVELRRRPAS